MLETDDAAVAQLVSLFERDCWLNAMHHEQASAARHAPSGARFCVCGLDDPAKACFTVIDSLQQLHALDLSHLSVVICSTVLRDGTGLDALAYLQGMRPDLPVVMVGFEPSMAVDAIRGGALDFVAVNSLRDLHVLPLTIEKSIVHQRIKLQNEQLQRDLKRSLAELAITNQQLQDAIHQLEALARTDELTGLSNRRWFNLMLEGNWAEATRNDLPLACLLIDLDGFKAVNDRKGHHHGDELLRLAAKVIRANCRQVDVPARYGGDEFCVLMAHTEPAEAAMVAKRILGEFELAMSRRPSDEPQVSMSIGMSHVNLSRPINAQELVSHADEAMYAAKWAGKQRVMVRDRDGVREAELYV